MKQKKAGRPPTYDFDSLKFPGQTIHFTVGCDDNVKSKLIKVSTSLYLYKKRRGVKWETAVRRHYLEGNDAILVYRLT